MSSVDEAETVGETGGSATTGATGADSGGDGIKYDVGDRWGSSTSSGEGECIAISESADAVVQPADIIFVIDNSGSMSSEIDEVQDRMNEFSQQIVDSGIDVRVIVVSMQAPGGPPVYYGICIDPPLGAGGCPVLDNNPPNYQHVDWNVYSNSGLDDFLDTYNDYEDTLRNDATKHLVIVSDDNASMAPASFDAAWLALDPSHASYRFHGIVATQNCSIAAQIGQAYITLAGMTNGVIGDLCLQDFQPVFDELATAVVEDAGLSCIYDIPPPPDGETFDPMEVNVEIDEGNGPEIIGHVDGAADCAMVSDGWYYDDNDDPTQIIACPQTCERFQNVLTGTIDIVFGCATVPAA